MLKVLLIPSTLSRTELDSSHSLHPMAYYYSCYWGFPGRSDSKESACNAGDTGTIPWVGKIPWRKAWQLTPVFLPTESHGQRSLVGYSP